MSTVATEEISETDVLALVAHVQARDPSLSSIGAGLLAAMQLGLCRDSRTFSRLFGISHALVLREITALSADGGFVTIPGRNERTQRTELALTERASFLFD